MYKFTNGIVVFDEKARDNYLKAGYKLVEKIVKESTKGSTNETSVGMNNDITTNEENDENSSNDGTIEEKPRGNKKTSK